MKSLKHLILILAATSFYSCLNKDFDPEEWALEPDLNFSGSVVVFNSTLSSDTIAVFTNYSSFDAVSSQEWCSVYADNARQRIIISTEPNMNVEQRSAIITVTINRGARSLSKDVSVVQMGGVWETVGNFNLYWGYEIGQSQKNQVIEALNDMVYIPAGEFLMGRTGDEIVDWSSPHQVKLSAFYISSLEVSQAQWNAIMGYNPSPQKDPALPVYNISWAEALDYITRLGKLTNLDVRLPSEAQWEYAARGGADTKGYIYAGSDNLAEVAALDDNLSQPFPRGLLKANELGLYDMSGNVAEFCMDWFEPYYAGDSSTDPTGPVSGIFKCVRGGNVSDATTSWCLKTSNRHWSDGRIDEPDLLTGLRIVIIP